MNGDYQSAPAHCSQTFLVSYVARLCLWDPLAPAFTASGPSAQQRPLSPQLPPLLAVSALTVSIRLSPWPHPPERPRPVALAWPHQMSTASVGLAAPHTANAPRRAADRAPLRRAGVRIHLPASSALRTQLSALAAVHHSAADRRLLQLSAGRRLLRQLAQVTPPMYPPFLPCHSPTPASTCMYMCMCMWMCTCMCMWP